MTSLRQIISNRQNALRSTGPKTAEGKRRSSQNAMRHGLTAETVIEPIEDPDDYRAFQASVTAEYEADTAVERELVLRLASLLWRLRRAGAIETGLMQIECDEAQDAPRSRGPDPHADLAVSISEGKDLEAEQSILDIARRFAKLPINAFALLGRYEASLWRQVRQTILTLERKQRQASARRWRMPPWQRNHGEPMGDEF
jgi:hypothetical protein